MQRRTLGKTGLEVSVIGFGSGPIGFLQIDARRVGTILNWLLDQGVNLIDTAAMYLGSEQAIGQSVGHRRDEYVLVSKCGPAYEDLPGEAWSAEVIAHTVDRALKRLRTDHLDVMLLHSCDLAILERGTALEALLRAREAGKVRFVGYSGDNQPAAYAAALPDMAVIETSINICDQANIDLVLPKTQAHHVGVIAKRPLANAAWKPLADQPGIYSDYARTYSDRFRLLAGELAALGLEDDAKTAWPERALRFTLAQPGVHAAIVGTTSADHARVNLAIAGKGPLDPDAVRALRSAFRHAESKAGQEWLGQA
ncbi:MAG: hypothetical protein A2W31_12245 [Planctomycetes bacterium RBG_16_64_10]|nr:MAG: hypothetical protein A2W31_12245 [Planctomycetes bacterium RBG_16_64_10]